VPPAVAAAVFGQIAAFAGYGFPRSHAVAFARLAYETCYLKAHHLSAFFCARLNAQPGGFYHPSVVIGDARRHGLAILGPDLSRSAYDCTLERSEGTAMGGAPAHPHAVRLGLRYVRGLAEVSGMALVAERDAGGPFRDLADLCRRAHGCLTPHAVAALIAAGACDTWGVARRQLQWALPAAWAGATGLALPPGPVALPAETAEERRGAEGWATDVTLGDHPLAAHRAALMAPGILALAALDDAPTGATGTVAGQLVILQRPPTARGVAFVTLEDETGLGNLVLSPEIDRAYRAALHAGPLVVATGRVQRRAGVVNVQVITICAG
jgi:error-prone DNA polymerase